ncbi:hypothetical protein [Sphingomonas sp.]|uniref:hypothetical protein n=1 Tax=Sphingomonas sp. TaxID=28214 RepID=UPI003CC67482
MLGLWSVRAALVLALVTAGSVEVSGAAPGGVLATLSSLVFPALFATAGFSAARPSTGATWREALVRRLRLGLPPYVFIIVVSVAILGPLATNLAFADYATTLDTYAYLLNLVGVPRYELPGVFEFNNAANVVNAIVWLAPCYLFVIAIAALRSNRRDVRAAPAALAAALALASLLVEALDLLNQGDRSLAVLILRGDGTAALLGGLLGAAAYQLRNWVPADRRLAIGAAVLVAAGARLGGNVGQFAPLLRVGVTVPITYLVVYLVLRPLPFAAIGRALAPFLPGLLLFSYPLQQVAIQYGPRPQGPLLNLALAGTATLLIAGAFWRAIGSRIVARPLAPKTIQASPARSVRRLWRTVRRLAPQAAVGYVGAAAAVAAVFLALLWMVYVASQPDIGEM